MLLWNAALDFDWSEISPTIFGAVFESTLNPETRRSGGMHYTSIENIHKVIDPLFLNDLRHEYEAILEEKVERLRNRRLDALQDKLASLTIFDPACGSGNFLTETYLSLRRLENDIIRERHHGQTMLGEFVNPIKVSINQFYGMEINDFAVTVATTALWISEAQMLSMTERIIHQDIDFLPLKTYSNIVEGNALRIDWENVVPKDRLNYIIGNPPFRGYTLQTNEQKEDLALTCPEFGNNIDYVSAWFYKAAHLMVGTKIMAALVSTNSITQGEQVAPIWSILYKKFGVIINFAYRTFRWDSEASLKAHVHCVIIGFSCTVSNEIKWLFTKGQPKIVSNINYYLTDGPNVFIERRQKPLFDVAPMCKGSQPTDGGNLILSLEEKNQLVSHNPQIEKYVRQFVGADEFINRKIRFCLWLKEANPADLRKSVEITRRIENVRNSRSASTKASTRKWADRPTLFTEDRQPRKTYIIVPSVSSERRRYVPMGFMSPDVIASNLVLIIPDATLYHFGILESNVHMAWMRAVCGRWKSDYRYSIDIVYNNFPWPNPTPEQKARIEQTAQTILDVRKHYQDNSLADLYDPDFMPSDLLQAHQDNDRAVMAAYGFPVKGFTESDCVARLFEMFQGLTK